VRWDQVSFNVPGLSPARDETRSVFAPSLSPSVSIVIVFPNHWLPSQRTWYMAFPINFISTEAYSSFPEQEGSRSTRSMEEMALHARYPSSLNFLSIQVYMFFASFNSLANSSTVCDRASRLITASNTWATWTCMFGYPHTEKTYGDKTWAAFTLWIIRCPVQSSID
jgi:hypothetical protein